MSAVHTEIELLLQIPFLFAGGLFRDAGKPLLPKCIGYNATMCSEFPELSSLPGYTKTECLFHLPLQRTPRNLLPYAYGRSKLRNGLVEKDPEDVQELA